MESLISTVHVMKSESANGKGLHRRLYKRLGGDAPINNLKMSFRTNT